MSVSTIIELIGVVAAFAALANALAWAQLQARDLATGPIAPGQTNPPKRRPF